MKLRLLRRGSTGDDVIELQSALINLGYKLGVADGIFGTKTESAVIQFQKDNGLVADGLVGPMTWGKIKTTTYEIYIIQSGDTFYKIALVQNITLSALLAANPGINPNTLMVGQAIRVPMNSQVNVAGNTPGNIQNLGYAAIQGNYVYYFLSSGTNPKTGAIYRMKNDGTEKVKLVDTGVDISPAPFINVVGDWAYYRYSTPVIYTYPRSDINTATPGTATAYAGSIYKIRTNGSENTKISDDNAQYITVLEGWIYYNTSKLSMYDTSTQPGIFKIKTDGTGKVKLVDFQEMGYIVNIADGFIYYFNNNDGTYRITLDGSGKTPIIDGSFMAFGTKDWLYYIVGDFSTDAQIYKTRFDGSQKMLLYSGSAIGNRINVSGDYVFFSTSPSKGIYKVKTDGTALVKISEDSGRNLSIAGGYIYYTIYYGLDNLETAMYRMKIDGTDRTNLTQ